MAGAECCFCSGCCWLVTYTVGLILSWVFSQSFFPESQVALAGAIMISIPIISVGGLAYIFCKLGVGTKDWAVGSVVALSGCCAACSSIFSFVGAVVLLVASIEAHTDLGNDRVTACGAIATILVFISAIGNISMWIGFKIDDDERSNSTRDPYSYTAKGFTTVTEA